MAAGTEVPKLLGIILLGDHEGMTFNLLQVQLLYSIGVGNSGRRSQNRFSRPCRLKTPGQLGVTGICQPRLVRTFRERRREGRRKDCDDRHRRSPSRAVPVSKQHGTVGVQRKPHAIVIFLVATFLKVKRNRKN